jgi:hypothetical protein
VALWWRINWLFLFGGQSSPGLLFSFVSGVEQKFDPVEPLFCGSSSKQNDLPLKTVRLLFLLRLLDGRNPATMIVFLYRLIDVIPPVFRHKRAAVQKHEPAEPRHVTQQSTLYHSKNHSFVCWILDPDSSHER